MKKVAIACQGGGSHTAFTAGVLQAILQAKRDDAAFQLVALSGTSGGAVCALLAWHGFITQDYARAVEQLQTFWTTAWPQGNASSATEFPSNELLVWLDRLPVKAEFSPYLLDVYLQSLPENLQTQFRERLDVQYLFKQLLRRYITEEAIRAALRQQPEAPELLIGACDVGNGRFQVFHGKHPDFSLDAVVASAAIPTLMKAVRIEQGAYQGVYWDGLFSQNPPVRELPGLLCAGQPRPPAIKPAPEAPDTREIWLIRINPRTCAREPKWMVDILDRRNELAGNLSLEQEIQFIQQINRFVQEGGLIEKRKDGVAVGRYEVIDIKEIELPSAAIEAKGWTLDSASKLDRRQEFLEMLRQEGQTQGAAFLAGQRLDD
ncbi:MAG: patatin-like phospholipase family protein [Candidatus Competibacteraceae bacterium]